MISSLLSGTSSETLRYQNSNVDEEKVDDFVALSLTLSKRRAGHAGQSQRRPANPSSQAVLCCAALRCAVVCCARLG